MQSVHIHAAKTHLSRLIEAALDGEDIVIAKGNVPVVRLVPVRKGGFRIGLFASQFGRAPDFLEPTGTDDLDLWEDAR